MRIGIYTDLHLCKTTSILPLHCEGSKYSTRLQYCIDTAKWMYDEFEKNNVDIIVNGGDTLDGLNMSAEEVSALSEFYSYSKGIEEIHIAGNHEKYGEESEFYTNKILSNLPFVKLYTEPCKINEYISVIPYTDSKNVTRELCESITNDVLVSHLDIKGCHLRDDFLSEDGVELDYLCDNFNFVMNGHMHGREHIDISHCKNKKGKAVWNVGSVTSGSFSDNNKYIPSISIFDTETREFTKINNPHSILFRRLNLKNTSQAMKEINSLKDNFRYCVNASCPYDIKNEVKSLILNKTNIIASRITVSEIKLNIDEETAEVTEELDNVESNKDIREQFLDYLTTLDSLKYPLEKYKEIVKESE